MRHLREGLWFVVRVLRVRDIEGQATAAADDDDDDDDNYYEDDDKV
jgi:hypothetical protein